MIDDGVDVVATTGSFGECHTLSMEEFDDARHTSAEIAKGRIPLFVGVTSLNTREVIRKDEDRREDERAGRPRRRAVLLPGFSGDGDPVLPRHRRSVSELGIMVYHNPPCHNITLKLPIMEELLKIRTWSR